MVICQTHGCTYDGIMNHQCSSCSFGIRNKVMGLIFSEIPSSRPYNGSSNHKMSYFFELFFEALKRRCTSNRHNPKEEKRAYGGI